MKTRAVRLYGKNDLRLEEFELPSLRSDEILAKVVSDSICMSTYKGVIQGTEHKRIPNDIDIHPIIVGHEFCGEIIKAGKRWENDFKTGEKFVMQTALNYQGTMDAPGFSFPYVGGDATYVVIPNIVMELGCLLKYEAEDYFHGSLSEPMSCIIGTFHACYHTKPGEYCHEMGIKEGGRMALLASCGPMGMGAIDYALHSDRRPSVLVVTDIDDDRLARTESIFTVEAAGKEGIELIYINTAKRSDIVAALKSYAPDGFDDVIVFAPVQAVVEQADKILGRDGCLNFFAGPKDKEFSASFNFYNVHYGATHIVGTSGGSISDMQEAIQLMNQGRINPSAMVTHIGGLDSVIDTTINLPHIGGGKKLVYTQIDMPMTAVVDLAKHHEYTGLAEIIIRNNGLWCNEAEKYLLKMYI